MDSRLGSEPSYTMVDLEDVVKNFCIARLIFFLILQAWTKALTTTSGVWMCNVYFIPFCKSVRK